MNDVLSIFPLVATLNSRIAISILNYSKGSQTIVASIYHLLQSLDRQVTTK